MNAALDGRDYVIPDDVQRLAGGDDDLDMTKT